MVNNLRSFERSELERNCKLQRLHRLSKNRVTSLTLKKGGRMRDPGNEFE